MADLNLTKILESTNIADELEDQLLAEIGATVVQEFKIDEESRSDWSKANEEWIKLATQVIEKKSWPWERSANVKFPLVTTAAMQFSARAYPALIPGLDVVKIRVVGEDPQGQKAARANRISKHMSYQILEEMTSWEEDMDKLTMIVPIVGCAFKKTYYDPLEQKNCSHLVHAKDLVVNYYAPSLERASRKTHILYKTPNEVKENQLNKYYRDVELPSSQAINEQNRPELDKVQGAKPPSSDPAAPYVLLEQHRFWDLDNDGYQEPYVVTVELQSAKVLRIVARFEEGAVQRSGDKITRIVPMEYFTMFPFIPNPDGGFYPLGFGALLGPLNQTVNTLLNQLLDAGTLSNLQSGFISKGIKMKAGRLAFEPGEWKVVQTSGDDLKKGIVPLPAKEPSTVLFQLLGTIVQSGKELASVAEIFVGKMPGQNTPATTTMATIEQGMKVFTAIYKRLFRALKYEYQKLYRLNRIYMNPQEMFMVLDTGQEMTAQQSDYEGDDTDVRPAADPTVVSEIQKLAKAQGLLELTQLGTVNKQEVTKRVLEAQGQENIQALMQVEPQPDPEVAKMQAEMQMQQQVHQMKMQMEQMKLQMKEMELNMKMQAEQMKLAMKAKEGQMKMSLQSAQHDLDMDQMEEEHFLSTEQTKEKAAQQEQLSEQKFQQQKRSQDLKAKAPKPKNGSNK